jgi:hypothetical protein
MAALGRFKFGTPEALQEKINNYFIKCEDEGDVPSLPGISLYLDIRRETFWYYASGKYQQYVTQQEKEAISSESEDIDKREPELIDAEYDLQIKGNSQGEEDIGAVKMRVSNIFKKARDKMETWWLKTGLSKNNPAFTIFYMKNAFGYSDNPNGTDTDKPQVLEVRLTIQPPDQPAQLQSTQPKQLPQVQVLPDKKTP